MGYDCIIFSLIIAAMGLFCAFEADLRAKKTSIGTSVETTIFSFFSIAAGIGVCGCALGFNS